MNTIQLFIIIMSTLSFFLMALDKLKAVKNGWRIPEKTLLLLSLFGGSIGTLLGMLVFRHKIRKAKFFLGIPLILLLQILFYLCIKKNASGTF